jgi:superfamily I DNA and/or RNA helicase
VVPVLLLLSLQGEEATVVILSLVRSRPDGNIGFLRLRNRINVLLSRAKHSMYLLGNAGMLMYGLLPNTGTCCCRSAT